MTDQVDRNAAMRLRNDLTGGKGRYHAGKSREKTMPGKRQLCEPLAPREWVFRMALVGMRFGPGIEIFHPVEICRTVDLFAQVRIFGFVAASMLFLPRRLSRCAVRFVRTELRDLARVGLAAILDFVGSTTLRHSSSLFAASIERIQI